MSILRPALVIDFSHILELEFLRAVWKHPETQEAVNIAEAAHIYSFSEDGPRGNDGMDDEDLNTAQNLLLACHDCHKTIDTEQKAGVPAGDDFRRILLEAKVDERLVEEALDITDKEEPNYELLSPSWPRSNPRGFAL